MVVLFTSISWHVIHSRPLALCVLGGQGAQREPLPGGAQSVLLLVSSSPCHLGHKWSREAGDHTEKAGSRVVSDSVSIGRDVPRQSLSFLK